MNKNILIITGSDFPYGSASAKLLRLLARGLVEKSWQVEVLLQKGRTNRGESMIPGRSGQENGVAYRFFGWKLRPANPLLKILDSLVANVGAAGTLVVRKIRGRADVAMIYNHSGVQNLLMLAVCKMVRIRCISYVSDWVNRKASFPKWHQQPKWFDFLFRMKIVNMWFDALVMPSTFLHDFYKDRGFDPDRLYILPTVVELPDLAAVRQECEYPKKAAVRIGFCGKPTWTNGGELLLQAFHRVSGCCKDTELIVMGDRLDDPALLPGLKKMADELGIGEKITFTGMIPYKRVGELLLTCDILALPRPAGKFAEAGFPTKLGEYVACRKPVVVTKTGDIPRYLKHRGSAMLSEPGGADEMAEHMLWLIEHPAEANAIAEKGWLWAKDMLSYSGAAEGLDRFLCGL